MAAQIVLDVRRHDLDVLSVQPWGEARVVGGREPLMAVGREWASRSIPVEHLPRYLGLDIPTCLAHSQASQPSNLRTSYQLPLGKPRL